MRTQTNTLPCSTASIQEADIERIRADARSLEGELLGVIACKCPDAHAALIRSGLLGNGDWPAGFDKERYSRLGTRLETLIAELSICDARAASLALRTVVAARVGSLPGLTSSVRRPQSIEPIYRREYGRILTAIQNPLCTVDFRDDSWRKNLAILDGRLIPVGAEFADPNAGLPRSTLFKGPLGQRIRTLICVLFQTHGFKPMFELHAHVHSLGDFHPQGWVESYRRLAELLILNPEYKGVIAASWFRDPVLARISPRLSYLRDYPERHGALMLYVGTDTSGTSGALARSPTRQRLFAEGRYVPTIHLMIWPRSAMIEWAQNEGKGIE